MSTDITRALRLLSGLAVLSLIFAAVPNGDAYRWVDVSAVSAVVVVVAAILGLLASRGQPILAVVAGALCAVAALVKLVSLAANNKGPIAGTPATMTFLAALALGFLVLGLADRIPAAATR